MRTDLLGLTSAEFSAWLGAAVGHDPTFHQAAYRALMRSGCWDPAAVPRWRRAGSDAAPLLGRLATLAEREQCPPVTSQIAAEDPAYGTTSKLALRLADGAEVEAVSIPMNHDGHRTVCVSSQVGCRMGCAFCRTARMGLVRNLSAHEILGQVVAVARATGQAPRNLVFMGMGEPLDNAEAVAQAVLVATDRAGLSLAWDHITVSTIGRSAGLARLTALGLHRANLAISLHAADDAVRSALVPPARLEPVAEIRRALLELAPALPRGRRYMVSVVVIPGVTDPPGLLAALAAWCAGLPVLVNLIPFNPFPGCNPAWRAPTTGEMRLASDRLYALGIPVRMRVTKGTQALAACGQLARGRSTGVPPVAT